MFFFSILCRLSVKTTSDICAVILKYTTVAKSGFSGRLKGPWSQNGRYDHTVKTKVDQRNETKKTVKTDFEKFQFYIDFTIGS